MGTCEMRISFGVGRCAERTFLMAKRDRSTKEMRWIKRVISLIKKRVDEFVIVLCIKISISATDSVCQL